MLRVAGRRVSSLSWRSGHPSPAAAFASRNPFPSADSNDRNSGIISSPPQAFSITNSFLDQIRGFGSGTLVAGEEMGLVPDLPATVAAIKNPTSKIVYDDHNHLAFKDKGGNASVDFNVGKSDRSGHKVTGKRKKLRSSFIVRK